MLSQSQSAYDLNFHRPTSTITRPFFMENKFVRFFFWGWGGDLEIPIKLVSYTSLPY
jgi:hypothetical protein